MASHRKQDACDDFGRVIANQLRQIDANHQLQCYLAAVLAIDRKANELTEEAAISSVRIIPSLPQLPTLPVPPAMPSLQMQTPPASSTPAFTSGYNRNMSSAEVQNFIQQHAGTHAGTC